jgi:uncharacterized protein (DUF1800 family)
MTMIKPSKPTNADTWAAYVPDEKSPWNFARVVHLHCRAAFAATWDEIQRDLKDGPRASVDRLLAGTSAKAMSGTFEKDAAVLADFAVGRGNATPVGGAAGSDHLKGWWIYRMLYGLDSLGERLALMWHGHFATSNIKVQSLAAMRRQNELFRKFARAPFGELLNAVVHDPALLEYLDAPANRKGHPNENLARELMELFTVGIGHYSEADVKDGARALTGWSTGHDGFREITKEHDDGEKAILHRSGRWHGEDLVKMLLEHPATSRRLAWRICQLLMGEGATTDSEIQALAEGLRKNNLDIGWAVATVLRSREFFAEANLATRVRGPVEHLVGTARALELPDPSPSTLALADWAARLGQDLFYPPNVGGWSGGRDWLSTATAIGRANYAAALVSGELGAGGRPFDALSLARRHDRGRDLDDLVSFYVQLLLGNDQEAAWRERLARAARPGKVLDEETSRRVVVLILASPEAQLN